MRKKLVLFDIDGTLIRTTNTSIDIWKQRLQSVFAEVFKPLPPFETAFVDGKVERHYFREFATSLGFSDEEFEKRYPQAKALFFSSFQKMVDEKEIHFFQIEDAYQLVTELQNRPDISLGLITGNNEPTAWLKLRVVDFDKPFTVGAFGDQADCRKELVLLAIQKANTHFKHTFLNSDVIVIGDTTHDIVAAKHVEAYAIGVATGLSDTATQLKKAGADIAVTSLMDQKVRALFKL